MASISDILLSQGRYAAESRRERAGQWVPLIQHLANLPNQVMADRAGERAAQEAAFDRGQQRDVRSQQLAKGQQELETAEATAEQKRQMNDLLSTPGVIGDDGRFDVQGAQRTATEKGYNDILDDVLTFGKEWNEGVEKGLLTKEQIEAAKRSNQPQGYTLNPGDKRYGPDNQEVASVPVTPPKPTMREVVVKGPNGRPVKKLVSEDELIQGIEQYEAPRVAPQGPQPGWQWVMRDGKEVYTNAVKDGDKPQNARVKATEDERKSAGWYGQMSDAIATMDEVEASLTPDELYQIQTLPQEGLIGMANRGKLSENAKRYLRAFEQFTEARLRSVSGAAISAGEYAGDRRTYAKQYSETPNLSKDRTRARGKALDTLKKRAGVALDDGGDTSAAPPAPAGWKYVPKPGGGWTAVEDK